MARVAFYRGVIVSVAIHALAHAKWVNLFNFVHPRNITMACLASNPLSYVAFVIKKDKIGKIVNANPFYRLVLVVSLPDFLNERTVQLNNTVAVHADIHSRNGSMARFSHIRVAIHTGDFVITRVNLMAKRNGLLRRVTVVSVHFIKHMSGTSGTYEDE